jgi:hypothetical protein
MTTPLPRSVAWLGYGVACLPSLRCAVFTVGIAAFIVLEAETPDRCRAANKRTCRAN